MKSVKMACVHPAALQLLQKLRELMLGSGSKVAAMGEGEEVVGETQTVSGGVGEMGKPVHGGETATLWGLERAGEGGGLEELCLGTEGPALCRPGHWMGFCSGLDPEKRDTSNMIQIGICYNVKG